MFSQVNQRISSLRTRGWEIEHERLMIQQARVHRLNRNGLIFASLAILIVISVSLLGRYVTRRMVQSLAMIELQHVQIQASARMSALGEMASGVAHEINNPLAIKMANADRLKEQANSGSVDELSIAKTAAVIDRTCQRIAKIIKGLRTFARDGHADPFAHESAKRIIDETLDLCRSKLTQSGIEIRLSVPAQDVIINCRATEISQVLLNLVNNARDAVEKARERWIEISLVEDEENVSISVTDSGPGIPQEIREKIMNPFFTTKEVGKGTGLGLSISSSIAKNHGGSLTLETGKLGTMFTLSVPTRSLPFLCI